jgi:hypothetical protein
VNAVGTPGMASARAPLWPPRAIWRQPDATPMADDQLLQCGEGASHSASMGDRARRWVLLGPVVSSERRPRTGGASCATDPGHRYSGACLAMRLAFATGKLAAKPTGCPIPTGKGLAGLVAGKGMLVLQQHSSRRFAVPPGLASHQRLLFGRLAWRKAGVVEAKRIQHPAWRPDLVDLPA